MNKVPARDPSGRVLEGHDALTMSARGQVAAPRVFLWGPIVAKLALAIFAAVVLAFIGMKAGAHSEPPTPEETRVVPAGVTSARPSTPPALPMAESSVEGAPSHGEV